MSEDSVGFAPGKMPLFKIATDGFGYFRGIEPVPDGEVYTREDMERAWDEGFKVSLECWAGRTQENAAGCLEENKYYESVGATGGRYFNPYRVEDKAE